jgi:hypothetical protein
MDSDNKKISQLTQVTSLNDSDLYVVSIDVPGAPKTRGIKKADTFPSWTTYSATVSAASGSITSYTVNKAQYCDIGKVRFYDIDVSITNNGTGATYLKVDLAAAPFSNFNNGLGRETAVAGFACFAFGFSSDSYVRVTISLQFWVRKA